MKQFKPFYILMIISLISFSSMAQEGKISGKVTSVTGEPIQEPPLRSNKLKKVPYRILQGTLSSKTCLMGIGSLR